MEQYHTKEKLSREELLKNDFFLNDAALFMAQRDERVFDSDEELFDSFVNIMRQSAVNEIDAYKNFKYISAADEEEKERAGKLFLTFDKMENPTSTYELIKDYGEGIFTAPSTYLSLIPGLGLAAKFGLTGATSLMAKGISQGAIKSISQTAKALAGKTVKGRALQGGIAAGTVEGSVGAVQGGLQAAARKETGAEPYKDLNIAKEAGVGAAFGAVPGVIIGGGMAARTAVGEKKAMELLTEGLAARKVGLEAGKKETAKLKKRKKSKKIFEKVSAALDPLGTRLSTELKEGSKSKKGIFHDEHTTASINADVLENMKGAAVEMLMRANATVDGKGNIVIKGTTKIEVPKTARLSEILHAALTHGETVGNLPDIMKKYGLTQDQLANIFLAEMSDAGRKLSSWGKRKQVILHALSQEHQTLSKIGLGDESMEQALKLYEKIPGKAKELFTNIDKGRLGLMTIQTATTARNTANASGRTFLFALDNLGHGILDMAHGTGTAIIKRDTELIYQGARRAASSFNVFKNLTWNASEANALRLIFAEEMPKTFSRLYRQNADVAAAAGLGSGFANFSRKLNVLNTLSDNTFKRAIFMTELQTLVGKKKLRELIKTGQFATIDKETIAKAMEEAVSFTYQKSYRGIDGKKTKASNILELFSTPYTTWLVPFPKFIMNSLEFMYTHAPVIGLADVPFKMFKKGGSTLAKQRMAKQVTGMGMLYGAIQLRAQQGPDAKWWEWYDKDTGQYENALAFYGPFAVYMLAADLILRSNMRNQSVKDATGLPLGNVPLVIGEETRKNWQRVADDPILETMVSSESDTLRQFFKATFGSTFRTGTGLEIVDALQKDLKESVIDPSGKFNPDHTKLKRAVATFGGNYVNTFGVGFGEIRDIYSIIDDEYKIIRDPDALTNPLDLFIAKALRSMPINGEGKILGLIKGPEGIETPARSATKGGSLYREASGRKQLTGRGTLRPKDVVEKALDFHRIPRYRAFPKLKDPTLDAMAKDIYNIYTAKRLFPTLTSREYVEAKKTPQGGRKQKRMLKSALDMGETKVHDTIIEKVGLKLSTLIAQGDNLEEIEKAENQLIYMFKLKFSKLSSSQRTEGKTFFKEKYNKAPETWKEYSELFNIAKQRSR